MIELTFLKEFMLLRQVSQENVAFVTVGIFLIKGLSFDQISTKGVMMY